MNALEFLSQFPKHGDFSRKSKVLLFAYYLRRHRGAPDFDHSDIRRCFSEAMLREPSDLSALLKTLVTGRQSPLLKSKDRYALSIHGLSEIEAIVPEGASTPEQLNVFLRAALPHLKGVIAKVVDDKRRSFLAEAIACLGGDARRATVVMTWLAALDHLQEHVVKHKLVDFNAACARRTDRYRSTVIVGRDDFGDVKESVFIEVCRSAGVITNDVRKILDEKLGFRNSCAHPSDIVIGESKVVSFIEDLVDNVMSKFPT